MSIPGWHASQERRSQNGDVIGPLTGQMSAPEPARIGAPEARSRRSTRFCSRASERSWARISASEGAPGEIRLPGPGAPPPGAGKSVAVSAWTTIWLGAPTDGSTAWTPPAWRWAISRSMLAPDDEWVRAPPVAADPCPPPASTTTPATGRPPTAAATAASSQGRARRARSMPAKYRQRTPGTRRLPTAPGVRGAPGIRRAWRKGSAGVHYREAMRSRLLLAVALLLVALPSGARAYRFQPEHHRWERARIPVWVGSSALRSPVARAISKWNALRLRVHFTQVTKRRDAWVTIRLDGNACVGGVTQVFGAQESGTVDGERYSIRYIARARTLIAPRCGPDLTTFVVAHELGHVLGLGHETRRCALMNPSADTGGASSQCPGLRIGDRARDPIRPDDRAGVRALYRRPLSTLPLSAYSQYIPF
jgi:matrixin